MPEQKRCKKGMLNCNSFFLNINGYTLGYTQPPQAATGYPVPPPPYGNVYPPPQSTTAYPPQAHAQPFTGYSLGPSAPQYGYSAPAQPQYSSIYNNPAFNPMPKANM